LGFESCDFGFVGCQALVFLFDHGRWRVIDEAAVAQFAFGSIQVCQFALE
jgi:hypothetical protein